jgi:signal transduction histidine kinase/ABC-type amino acid transport substrate-binding protein
MSIRKIIFTFILSSFASIASATNNSESSPTIGIAKSGWAPFLMVDGVEPTGYLVDYLNLAANKANLKIKWDVVANRSQLLANVKDGEYDLFIYGGKPSLYDAEFQAGMTLFPRYISAFSQQGKVQAPLNSKQLESLIIAAPSAKLISNHYPNATIYPTNSIKDSLIAVATGKADIAFVDHAVGIHALSSALLPNFEVNPAPKPIQDSYQPMRLLYNKSTKDSFMPQLEAGRALINNEELSELQLKWNLVSSAPKHSATFTADELKWIEDNRIIRTGSYQDIPPYSFEKDGQIVGYSIDYMQLISEITGLEFIFESRQAWSEQLKMAESRQLDVLQLLRERETIARYMNFTQPYVTGSPTVLYGRDGQTKVNSIARIIDKTIAVRRDYLEETYLIQHHPELNLKVVDSIQDGLNTVLTGEADYFVCQTNTCDSYLYQNFITNLSVVGHLGIPALKGTNRARFAIRSDWPELQSIFNKAIDAIPENDLEKLKRKWLNQVDREQLLIENLTEAEKKWLSGNRRLAFALPLKLPPFAFVEEQEPKGIASDIVKRFESEYSIDAHYTHFSSWTEIVDAITSGDIDFVPSMNITEERKKKLLFTQPFLNMNAVILTQKGKGIIPTLDSVSTRKLGMARGSSMLQAIKKDYPDIQIVEYSKMSDALYALSNGEIDLTVTSPFAAKYQLTSLGIDNIVQSGTTKYNQPVAIAVHPSKPELVTLFNKLIASIEPSEINLILDKWNNLQIVEKKDWVAVVVWSTAGIIAVVFILLLLNYFKRNENLKVIEKVGQRLANAQRVAQLGSWDVDAENKIIALSTEAANILGVSETKTMSRIEYAQLIVGEDRKRYIEAIDEALRTGLLNVEYRIKVNDSVKWVKEVSELVFGNSGEFLSASTTIQDISEFKRQQDDLIEHQEELRDLTSKLLSVQEEERKRVARELHDDLSQRLAVLSIDLGALHNQTESEDAKLRIRKVKQDIVSVAEDTHSLSRRLHPSIIDDLGLIEALRSEIDSYQRREEIKVEFFSTMQTLSLDKDVELVIFRVVQEALRNVAKYSEASMVKISLASIHGSLFLQIQDDGMGFDVEAARKAPGLGLKSMMERARLINAEFNISSEENHGVNIELQIPLDK